MEDDIKSIVILILLIFCFITTCFTIGLYGEYEGDKKEIEYLKLICEDKNE